MLLFKVTHSRLCHNNIRALTNCETLNMYRVYRELHTPFQGRPGKLNAILCNGIDSMEHSYIFRTNSYLLLLRFFSQKQVENIKKHFA